MTYPCLAGDHLKQENHVQVLMNLVSLSNSTREYFYKALSKSFRIMHDLLRLPSIVFSNANCNVTQCYCAKVCAYL